MPLYEYRCRECGAEFEELIGINDTAPPPCPACSSVTTEKMISLFGSISGSGNAGGSCGGGSTGFT